MSFEVIQAEIGKLYREETTDVEAEAAIAELPAAFLAEFIVDAFGRGWISRFNLGLDDEGKVI